MVSLQRYVLYLLVDRLGVHRLAVNWLRCLARGNGELMPIDAMTAGGIVLLAAMCISGQRIAPSTNYSATVYRCDRLVHYHWFLRAFSAPDLAL